MAFSIPRMAFCNAWPTLLATVRTSSQWQSVGDLEPVILRELGVFLVAAGFRQRGLIFLVMHIGDALEEQERENVGLEISGIHRPAQDVGRLPEMRFELAQSHSLLSRQNVVCLRQFMVFPRCH